MGTLSVNKNALNNEKGFSLVELMVVVAIIGILASIAVPSLQKYMAKARQSEAKTTLASLYTAEKAFFAEYNTYSPDWGALGFQPEGRLRYMTGFSAGDTAARLTGFGYTTAPSGTFSTTAACNAPTAPNGPRTCTMSSESTSGSLASGTSANYQTGFTAEASSQIYTANSSPVDNWTINQDKNIKNIQPGIL